jgi:hypothetical protein
MHKLLDLYLSMGVLNHLSLRLVHLKNCLTFKIPSSIILSIPDSINLKENRSACHSYAEAERKRPLMSDDLVLVMPCRPQKQF